MTTRAVTDSIGSVWGFGAAAALKRRRAALSHRGEWCEGQGLGYCWCTFWDWLLVLVIGLKLIRYVKKLRKRENQLVVPFWLTQVHEDTDVRTQVHEDTDVRMRTFSGWRYAEKWVDFFFQKRMTRVFDICPFRANPFDTLFHNQSSLGVCYSIVCNALLIGF